MQSTTQGIWTDNVLEGACIHYDTLSAPIKMPNGRLVYEKMASGAFAQSVALINQGTERIAANVEHAADNALMQIGSTSENITLEHRNDGVYMRMTLLDDTVSQDLYKRVKANLVGGLSIEFQPYPGEEPKYEISNGNYIRTWQRLRLVGFAVVKSPMYPDAKCFARSIDAAEFEAIAKKVESLAVGRRRLYEYEAYLMGIR